MRGTRHLAALGRWPAAAVLTVSLILAACSSDSVPTQPEASPTGESADTTETVPTAAPTPTAEGVIESAVEVPGQTIIFGGVEFTVTGAVLSNEDPDSRIAGRGLITDDRFLHLEIAVENPTMLSTLSINDRDFVHLRTTSGTQSTQVFSPDIGPRSVIGPGVTGTYLASFEMDEAFDPTGASVVFGGSDLQQIVVPFEPKGPSLPLFPRPVAVELTGTVDGRIVCGDTTLTVDTITGIATLDNPADIASTGGLGRRARAGQVFLQLSVDLTVVETVGGVGGGGGCVGTIVSDDLINLAVGGEMLAARYVAGDADVEARTGDTVTITVGFMVPVDEPSTLTIGRAGARTVSATFSL
jgi:hypothetical protein